MSETPKLEFSFEQLQQLIATAVATATKESSEKLAAAIIEASPKHKSEAQKQNDQQIKATNKELTERIRKEILDSQTSCPHRQGANSLSNFQSTLNSFVLHVLDTGDVVGICTNCQKIIRHSNPADALFFKDKSGNVPSQAGRRFFRDQEAAIQRGKLPDYKPVEKTENVSPVVGQDDQLVESK